VLLALPRACSRRLHRHPRPALPTAGKLLAKQAEAIRLRTAMIQVEAMVNVLQPDFNVCGIAAKRRNKSTPWFKRGTLFRSAVDVLRRAPAPMTAREVVETLIADRAPQAMRKQAVDPAGGYSFCPSEAERRDGGWRGSASAVAIEGERLTSRAMASDKIGHHSNLLTYRVPISSMHWPPKKTNSPSMPIAARTVHLGHGMAMSRICAGNRSIFQHGTWVPRNRPP
jgi:hypothetical protein